MTIVQIASDFNYAGIDSRHRRCHRVRDLQVGQAHALSADSSSQSHVLELAGGTNCKNTGATKGIGLGLGARIRVATHVLLFESSANNLTGYSLVVGKLKASAIRPIRENVTAYVGPSRHC
jgi:hypothetical protein